MRKILAVTAVAGFAFAGLGVAMPTAAHAVSSTYAIASPASSDTEKTVSAECYNGGKALNYDVSANKDGNAALAGQPQAILDQYDCPIGWTATFLHEGGRIVVTCFGGNA